MVKSGKRHCFCAESLKYSLDILPSQIIFPPFFQQFLERDTFLRSPFHCIFSCAEIISTAFLHPVCLHEYLLGEIRPVDAVWSK